MTRWWDWTDVRMLAGLAARFAVRLWLLLALMAGAIYVLIRFIKWAWTG